jgi:hypothetical protein
MKIPSEAELIEMERRAWEVSGDYEFEDEDFTNPVSPRTYHLAQDLLKLTALLRQVAPPAPIPPMAPRRKRRGTKVACAHQR